MAIVVPFIIANTAVGAAAAAAIGIGATTLATITTVAFAVTGINDKINKAAASVFGEDLVKVANIAGMAYGAFNGGFDIGGGAGMSTAAADTALDAFDATQAGAGMSEVAADTALTAFDASQAAPVDALGDATGASNATAGLDAFSVPADAVSPSSPLTNLTANSAAFPATEVAPQTFDLSASAGATGNNAAAFAPNAGSDISAAASRAPAPGGSFFDNMLSGAKKLVTNKDGTISNGALQAGGNILQGAFGGYSSAKAREQAQANYDAQAARQARLANLGLGGWKQTQ